MMTVDYKISAEDKEYVLAFLKDISARVEGIVFQMRVDKAIIILQRLEELR